MIIKSYIKKLKYYLRYLFINDEKYIKYKFKRKFGYTLNLNNPKTLNEKIQWLKVYDRKKLYTQCADKFLVREYVKNKIGEEYLIPLIFNTFNVKDINKETLPNIPVVVKVNHARGVFLIKNKENEDFKIIQKKLSQELKTNFYYRTREWQYKDIKPRVIVEKMLLDENNEVPFDYKFICMNGKVEFIQVDMARFSEHKKSIYNTHWEKQNFSWNYAIGDDVEKPEELHKMLELSEILAKDFIFVRVDFYISRNKIYFGELTFHPAGGFGKFEPFSIDAELGNKLLLPKIKDLT